MSQLAKLYQKEILIMLLNNTTNLVEIRDDQIVTSTLQVAKTFKKEHRVVLKAIDDLIKEGVAQNYAGPLFMESTYQHPQNRQHYRMYYMTKDGFSLLVMGFTGKKAMEFKLAYIDQFNKMEHRIKLSNADSYMIDDPIERAKKWMEEQKRTQQIEQQNQIMLPKARFADAVSDSDDAILVRELAKYIEQNIVGFHIGQNQLFKWLRDNGYLIKKPGHDYNTPTQRAMKMKLFVINKTSIRHSDGSVTISKTVRVTGKGQQYFVNKLLTWYKNKELF